LGTLCFEQRGDAIFKDECRSLPGHEGFLTDDHACIGDAGERSQRRVERRESSVRVHEWNHPLRCGGPADDHAVVVDVGQSGRACARETDRREHEIGSERLQQRLDAIGTAL
jgi:hypothetical protein